MNTAFFLELEQHLITLGYEVQLKVFEDTSATVDMKLPGRDSRRTMLRFISYDNSAACIATDEELNATEVMFVTAKELANKLLLLDPNNLPDIDFRQFTGLPRN